MRDALQKALSVIVKIQDLDIKLIRLMKVKRERQGEMEKVKEHLESIRKQLDDKEKQILELKKDMRLGEVQIKEIQEKVVKLEAQQAQVKKMDEFNAITHEITQAGRERHAIEGKLSDLTDKLAQEEDLLVALKKNLEVTEKNSVALEKEIHDAVVGINHEGEALLKEREELIPQVDKEMFSIYERLLKNKKDRVLVPIENRSCSGCHIVLTAQDENLVRRGDRLVYCEHCSRILFWQEAPKEEEETTAPRRRRRRATT